ncbi:MAG: ABC transporter permease [Vicinamibacterales bacterium]
MRIRRWWSTARLRLRSILRFGQVERELDEELEFHLHHKIEEGIANGLSPGAARQAALRAMEGLEQQKEAIRDARRVHWLTDFVDDAHYALRSLRRTPGLTLFVVMTLALGIGMTVTPFSMADALVFRPYPVPHPGNVVTLVGTSRENRFDLFSHREYLDIRANTTSYDDVLASTALVAVGFSPDVGMPARVRTAMMVSGNYFRALDVEPTLGRAFRDDEDAVRGRDAVAVLGPDFWRHEFDGDPSVVGRTIRLNGRAFTVIGVAPEAFTGMLLFSRPDVYVPLAMADAFSTNPRKDFFRDRDDREVSVKARLKSGVSLASARSELAALATRFERDYPEETADRGAAVRTRIEMRTQGDAVEWKFAVIFSVLGIVVLLVACTNVAGLLLSRARTRRREIAVRLALGAGRFRLIRLLLTESLILGCAGGLGGLAVGYGGITLLRRFSIPSELPVEIPFRMDGRMLTASLVLALGSALVCGLAPALQSSRADVVTGLKSADVDEPGQRRLWGRSALVVAQVAMSLMLLTASFLMFRGFHRAFLQGTGFPTDHLLLASFDPRLLQYDADHTEQFYTRLAERVRGVPGVQRVTLTQNPPLGLEDFERVAFVPDGLEMPRNRETFDVSMDTIGEDYFETLGIPVVRGRGFLASDTADAPRVAVINEALARRYWPDGDAVGRRVRLDDASATPVEIVGVARTIKYRDGDPGGTPFLYMPRTQRQVSRLVLMVRARASMADPIALMPAVREIVHALDPNMPMLQARSYDDLMRYSTVDGPGVAVRLVGTMGGGGLVLAVAGLYGLVAYSASRRTREIGIRIALGAVVGDVLRLVMGRGLALVGLGTLIGLALGFGVEQLMNAMLFHAGGVDLVAYLVVVPSMCLVTMLATYVPARRASRIAPTQALRQE